MIHNQLDAYNEMSALLQQQFAVQQEKDDLHKSKGDLQERINAMQKEHEKILPLRRKIFFISCRIQRKKKFPFSNNSLMRLNRCRNLRELQLLMKKQIAILNNRIDELEKQLEVYQAKENEIAQEEEKQLEHIPVKRRIIWSSFFMTLK